MSIKNSLNRAEVLFNQAEFESSLAICQKILAKKPKLFNAIQLSALNYQAMGLIDKALIAFEKAIAINDHHASTFNNMGNIYLNKKDYETAVRFYAKSLKIEPLMAQAHNNFALCHYKLGDHDLAEAHYKKAILNDATVFEFYTNLGSLYAAQGKFDAAQEMYIKSLEINKENAKAYWSSFRVQLYSHRYQDTLEVADLAIMSQALAEHELCSFLVGKAIVFLLFEHFEEAKQAIELSEKIYQFEHMSSHMANMTVFHRYIKRLLSLRAQNTALYALTQDSNPKEMYFISESHGFSPNGTIVQYNNEAYKIRSLFIMGAKIFHLIDDRDNKYQVSLALLLEGLPTGSKVVIGIGEIDCRYNEGIFAYYLKSGKDYREVIDNMLEKYISLLKNIAETLQLEIIFYGVPAPHPYYVDKLQVDEQKAFKTLIEYYNQTLENLCQHYQIQFLDVYHLTNQNGQSSLEYHIDGIHLSPHVVPELFDALST